MRTGAPSSCSQAAKLEFKEYNFYYEGGMSVTVATEDALRCAAALRLAARGSRSLERRERLSIGERRLRGALGPSVPKQAAARALGVSLTGLDRWIDRGLVPVVRNAGSSRLRPETGPLLELLVEIERLREHGRSGRLVSAALRSLGRRPIRDGRWIVSSELARLPRPNVPAWELRASATSTTPLDRLDAVAELSEALTGLAQLKGSP